MLVGFIEGEITGVVVVYGGKDYWCCGLLRQRLLVLL